MFQLVMDEFCNFFPSGCDEGNLWAETRLAQNGKTLSFLRARLDHRPLLLLPSKADEKELIQPPISYFDYHDLRLKSTAAMKLLDLTLTGSRHYIITIKAHLHHFGYYGNKDYKRASRNTENLSNTKANEILPEFQKCLLDKKPVPEKI